MIRNAHSEASVLDYCAASKEDRRAVSYEHLDAYISGSLGKESFRGKAVRPRAWAHNPLIASCSYLVAMK